ncbi:polysaccharide deacetylase family protein [Aquabacter spiritensis]|uniref:Chitooligosaccharide deacetylase n=1 Tax=Aquabacter spiritensis TaxID=933073 RepID=A0A4R3LQC7_9HYPH|nr:polysaccharide deacetylase family protein [Aquabacter spiritensis]TCT02431.1 peptidoglycan/xylan/chitin deacetylase (PgdA/CDA1 family) [Aquabacter spiritensis]
MRSIFLAGALVALAGAAGAAETCPGNPNAIGTSREITIDPKQTPFLGNLQYKTTAPLQKGEVILTFDDGPLPPMTTRVLDTLAQNCVKATFFIVGRMASAYPTVLQRVAQDGHTIGTHSQNHPLIFPKLKQASGIQEIDQGFASTNAALAPIGAHTVPFFRFPGLGRTKAFEAYTQEHGIAVFSVDAVADDWLHLKPEEVMKRALDRLEARGSGILLLHDIQPSTVVMLPTFLKELKARGFKIVHMKYGENPMVAAPAAPAAPVAVAPTPDSKPVAAAAPAAPETTSSVTPAARTTAVARAPAAVPMPVPNPTQALPGGRALTDPVETPFTLFWPRILSDMIPKGLQ